MRQLGGPTGVGQDHPPVTTDQDIANHAIAAPVAAGPTADGLPQRTVNITMPVLQQTLAGYAVLRQCQGN